jgi:hypothetical protein
MCTITNFVEQVGEIWLTPLFWDCECVEEYIHPASDAFCYRCTAKRGESPDSRVTEIIKYADTLPKGLVAIVEEAIDTAVPAFSLIPF